MKNLLLIAFFLTSTILSSANHFSGGYIRYEKTNTANVFNIYLTLYKTCDSRSIDYPTFAKIELRGLNNSLIKNVNIPLISSDTVQEYCSGTTTSCQNLSSTYPGQIVGNYMGTVTLSQQFITGKLVFTNSNRNLGITNLQGSSGQPFYTETLINITNNSAELVNAPPHVFYVNDTIKIPLNAIDKDDDEVVFKLTQPKTSATKFAQYSVGHGISNCFGVVNSCYIDNSNNLVMISPNIGKYSIAIRIEENRNQKNISNTIVDFVVNCINPGNNSKISIPHPDISPNQVSLYTCPGKKNNIRLKFTDSEPQDSILLDIKPASNVNTWNFALSTDKGVGTLPTTLSWTTPKTLNPNTLPYFDVRIDARDNGCKVIGKGTYIFRINTRECEADSVWPGDANSDKIANMYDVLAIALSYADTGAKRQSATTNWTGQVCPSWNQSILNNINKKHADCNGDGKVDATDLTSINLNYSKTHAKRPQNKTTGTPNLSFDHSGITPNPDSNVSIKILLGTSSDKIENIYGLATNIQIDGLSLVNPATVSQINNFIGTTSQTLHFTHAVSNQSIDWALARTNKANTSGNGTLATLNFKIPSNTTDGQLVKLVFNQTKIINKDGKYITQYGTLVDSFYIKRPTNIANIGTVINNVSIHPNPGKEHIIITLNDAKSGQVDISLLDLTGRALQTQSIDLQQGVYNINVDTHNLPAGAYIISINQNGVRSIHKWNKI